MQQAVFGRRDILINLDGSGIGATRVGRNVEARIGNAVDREAYAAQSLACYARLRKVKLQLIDARFERYLIGELAFSPRLEDLGVLRAKNRMSTVKSLAAGKESVGKPNAACLIDVIACAFPGQNADAVIALEACRRRF